MVIMIITMIVNMIIMIMIIIILVLRGYVFRSRFYEAKDSLYRLLGLPLSCLPVSR